MLVAPAIVLLCCLSLPKVPPEQELTPLHRFPPRAVSLAQRELSSAVMAAVGESPAWSEQEQMDRAGLLREAWRVWDVWDELCRAEDDTCEDDMRLHHLDLLRERLGEDAFMAGQMPSPSLLLLR